MNGVSWSPTHATGTPRRMRTFMRVTTRFQCKGSAIRVPEVPRALKASPSLLLDVTGPGTYSLGDESTTSYGWYIRSDGLLSDPGYVTALYRTTDAVTGTVVLTAFDPGTHTLRGTFDFRARSAQTGATVTITAGAFDGSFQALPGHS